jgi:hypothetical protein
MKARERPWTRKEERGRKHEEMVERQGEQKKKKKTERPQTGKPVEREKKTTQGDTQRQGTNERTRERNKG